MNSNADRLVERIYAAATGDEPWSDLLCDIADLGGMEHAMLVSVDPEAGRASVTAPRADPAFVDAYADRWWRHDPASPMAAPLPGKFTVRAAVHGRFDRAALFYDGFLRHAGLGTEAVLVSLMREDRAFANFAMPASARNDSIGADTLRAARFFAPHLMRSARISHQLQRMRAGLRAALSPGATADGVILVDAARRLLFANAMAESFLSDPDFPVSVSGARIALRDRARDAELGAALSALLTDGRKSAARRLTIAGNGLAALEIDILPGRGNEACPFGTRPCAMLLVRRVHQSPGATTATLIERFGLTPREAMIAREILKGDGRAAVAARCGISVNTVRTHLERVFEKTGVRRQAELIRLLIDQRR